MNQPSTNTITTLLKHNTTKSHITYTMDIQPTHISSNVTHIHIHTITIKQHVTTNIAHNIITNTLYIIMDMY